MIYILLLLFVFINPWLIKLVQYNIFLTALIVIASISLKKSLPLVTAILFILLLFLQYITTSIENSRVFTDDQKRVTLEQKEAYYPLHFSFLGKNLWFEVDDFFEQNYFLVKGRKVTKNILENLDINLYFLANHPRQRVGIDEFEKYPYALLPLFIIGLVTVIRQRKKYLLLFLLIPLLLTGFIGNKNNLGPFSLIPFITVVMLLGAYEITQYLKKNNFKYKDLLLRGYLMILLLSLMQSLIYEAY